MSDTLTVEQRLMVVRLELRRALFSLANDTRHRAAMARTQIEAALQTVEQALAFLQASQSSSGVPIPSFVPPVDPRKV